MREERNAQSCSARGDCWGAAEVGCKRAGLLRVWKKVVMEGIMHSRREIFLQILQCTIVIF